MKSGTQRIWEGEMKEHRYYLGKCDGYGIGRRNCKAYLTWTLENGQFSMSGEIWNTKETNIIWGGQCVDVVVSYFPGDTQAQQMAAIWKRWHLNDMQAGCEHQRADKWDERPIDPTKPLNAMVPCEVCGYQYGSAWLTEELPQDVINMILKWSAEPALTT